MGNFFNMEAGFRKRTSRGSLLACCLLVLLVETASGQPGEVARVSSPGKYQGYSRPVYDRWTRTSQYVTTRDGTKLAVDIFRPARDEKPVDEPLPVIWAYDRYHRADGRGFRLVTQLDQEYWLQEIIKHGYVVGVVDARGSGASFGQWDGPFTQKQAWDTYDITEWFAAQPWCNRKVGMFGNSYLGVMQYLAAGAAPPHLKAVFPEMAIFDLYSSVYPGGIYRGGIVASVSNMLKTLDSETATTPVDDDQDGRLLAEALAEHRNNKDLENMYGALPYRDSKDDSGLTPFTTQSPHNYLGKIKSSGVAVYHLGGWFDAATKDTFLWFGNLENPQKIVVGPWSHGNVREFDLAAEHLRWYDYWLKDINNGIMDEPPVYYYTMGARAGEQWRASTSWPPSNAVATKYYFQAGASGSVKSQNDGMLSDAPVPQATGQDDYTLNYTTTSGPASRWIAGIGGTLNYPDMASNDEKALTYTSAPLSADVEVTGHPFVNLWVGSDAPDSDFFIYLEDVDKNGRSQYVTEGALRGSHRAVSAPPFRHFELNSYHRSFSSDMAALTQQPVELALDLQPTSKIFPRGHRIRVTITGADKDNASTPARTPAPVISLQRNQQYSSYIVLPIIPGAVAADSSAGDTSTGISPAPRGFSLRWIVIFACAMALLLFVAFKFKKRRV